ncbi:MAG TPA: acyl-CoA dehydrogenase family protein [Pseudonocardiaceae bacterium]|nr:acyl-CoA dehydrogenase family protein [Pseudonocardiaceae bacterium]
MNCATSVAIDPWLRPLRPILDPADQVDWQQLNNLTAALDTALAVHPVGPDVPSGPERSRRLLAIRRQLARHGHVDTSQPSLFGIAAQFVCGYLDIDLRDATGLGHGRLINRHGSEQARRQWLPRLLTGELAGIAVTEPHGGSSPAASRTRAVVGPGGAWRVSGRKTWISRLCEAAVFVVFFRAPDEEFCAAVVDATEPGLCRQQVSPTGLAGWTWGGLDLDGVVVQPEDVLRGDGMVLLREHFASYRPLVAATALGGSAAVFDAVSAGLTARLAVGDLSRLRDSTLVTLGRAHAQLVTSLLGVTVAFRLSEAGHQDAELWGAEMKAHGVDVANQVAGDVAVLLGAAGFRADSQIAKVRRDLNGLLYADGIHDSLYRTAGKRHTSSDGRPAVPRQRGNKEPAPVTV